MENETEKNMGWERHIDPSYFSKEIVNRIYAEISGFVYMDKIMYSLEIHIPKDLSIIDEEIKIECHEYHHLFFEEIEEDAKKVINSLTK